jgi:hypothetical protein
MRIVLFCEQQYATSILAPLQAEASREGGHSVLWYVDRRNIPDFPLQREVEWTNSIQATRDFSPEAIFVPGNIVPYYLPGVKAEIFHGYASEKKSHWVIRHYMDLYLTQGPYFTRRFEQLAREHGTFEVVETGWTRQDWIHENLHAFDEQRRQLLAGDAERQVVLYAPTFSPSLTSLPFLKEALERLVEERNIVLLLKFHPLTRPEWVEEYRALAARHERVTWIDDHRLTPCILLSDLVISDTSSALYEALLLDKPVITFRNAAAGKHALDITDARQLDAALDEARSSEELARKRQWIIENYDPHRDGLASRRMLDAVAGYIERHGVPEKRKLNPWRKYQCIKKFGTVRHP